MPARDLADLRTADEDERFLPVDEYEPLQVSQVSAELEHTLTLRFQDIGIFFDESKFSSAEWPKSFERLIETNPYISDVDLTPTRAGRSRRSPSSTPNPSVTPQEYEFESFFGSSNLPVKAHYYGRIHGLPPQQGIPGFQRISFLRFQLTDGGDLDDTQIWGYEGCVMPGGRIIVGKWWHITTDHLTVEPIHRYSGPFVFWNVDNSTADPPIEHEVAIQFLDSLRQAGVAR
jgi:hypothetical protein